MHIGCTCGRKKAQRHLTQIVKKTLDPVWDEVLTFEGVDESTLREQSLRLKCYDHDGPRLGINAFEPTYAIMVSSCGSLLSTLSSGAKN